MAPAAAKVCVNVKFQKQLFSDVEVDTSESALMFMTQLWTLTGVPVDRQSILGFKGGKLKEDAADWGKLGLRAGMTVTLIGTPGELPTEPEHKVIFQEDMKETQILDPEQAQIQASMDNRKGLLNLGNTCYANATVQCLSVVPELRQSLAANPESASPMEGSFMTALNSVFQRLDQPGGYDNVSPLAFIEALRRINPQFGERSPQGFWMQQDAEECWSTILATLSRSLKDTSARAPLAGAAGSGQAAPGSQQSKRNLIDALFGLEMVVNDTCTETDEKITRTEQSRFLKCHISAKVSHLAEGLREGMNEEIELQSTSLGRSALWKRQTRISRLPPYLALSFVRFLWKPNERVKAKILRPVSFPVENLDLHEFCDEALQKRMEPARAKLAEALRADALKGHPVDDSGPAEDPMAMQVDSKSGAVADIFSDGTVNGNYELHAVLTHQGRDADSGHYIAFLRLNDKVWAKMDDDTVSASSLEEIKKLGEAAATAAIPYICLYKARGTPTSDNDLYA
ncbi:Ubiquitin carboxyl-terminal hydrolase 14 [Porphyridium purpureum]|uniref:Ubiquitin carboxyl-terminal hydrolase n=1 Tax=Porphyridium purpureum TaxID=35688 RepID=A0A5J4Z0F2_PORPP|nr:Ubiquitin carboxyl-terminal hydrolase 14 [Porphyridium purpureum]|eukprot:POR0453..scf208_2